MSLAQMMAEEVGYRARVDAASGKPALAGHDQKAVDDALSVLTKYIPTEVIGLYLPGLAAASVIFSGQDPTRGPMLAYWTFAVGVTPVLVLGTYMYQRKVAGQTPWPGLQGFPVWKIVAAILAFMTWALAIPGNPYVTRPDHGLVSGFLALAVSMVLSFVEKLVRPSSKPAAASSPGV